MEELRVPERSANAIMVNSLFKSGMKRRYALIFFVWLMGCGGVPGNTDRGIAGFRTMTITSIGKAYQPDSTQVLLAQRRASMGGSTSVRNVDEKHLQWKSEGYFQRNRDLGQVFLATSDWDLGAIVLRTGPSDKAVLEGTPGSKVFVQFFEVSGTPRINDNGTPVGTRARHGFSESNRCDDFLEGVTYRPMGIVYEGTFPDVPVTFMDGKAVGVDHGRMLYLRWQLDEPLSLRAGQRYAFMVGFSEPGGSRGFTLANANAAGMDVPPALGDEHDAYPYGWGLRREGDGTIPPEISPAEIAPTDHTGRALHTRQSLFPSGEERYLILPVTDGYPDVDTYRDFEFILEKPRI